MTYAYHPTEAQIDFIYDLIEHRQKRAGALEPQADVVMARSADLFENYLDLVITIHHVFHNAEGLNPDERESAVMLLAHWMDCFHVQASTNSPDTEGHLIKMHTLLHEARLKGPPGWFYDKASLQDLFDQYDRDYIGQFKVTDSSKQFKFFDQNGYATGDLSTLVLTVPDNILRTEILQMTFENETATARAIDQLSLANPNAAMRITALTTAECASRFTSTKSPLYNSVILRRYPRTGQYMGNCIDGAFNAAEAPKTSKEFIRAPGNLANLMFESPAYVNRGLPEDMFRHLMAKKASDEYKNHALLLPMIQQVVKMGFPLLRLASACLVNTWLGFDSDDDGLRDSAIFLLSAAQRAPKLSSPNRDALLGLWYIKTAPVSELLALPLKDETLVFLHEMTRSSEFLQGIKNKTLRDQVIGSDLGL